MAQQWKSLLVSWWWLILALGGQGLVHRLGVSNRFGTVLVVAMTKLIDLIDLIATSTNELLYWMTIG